jgi:hypothetical protein
VTDKTLDEKTRDAMSRLDAREDPPPPPELPKEGVRNVFDVRMIINEVWVDGKKQGTTLDMINGRGDKLHPQQGFATLIRWVAGLTSVQEWIDKRIRLHSRRITERIVELQKLNTPPGMKQG